MLCASVRSSRPRMLVLKRNERERSTKEREEMSQPAAAKMGNVQSASLDASSRDSTRSDQSISRGQFMYRRPSLLPLRTMPAPSARAGPSRLPARRIDLSESENDSDGDGGATPSPRRRRINGHGASNGHTNGNGNATLATEDEDSLEGWTVDTFESRPVPKSGTTSGAVRPSTDTAQHRLMTATSGRRQVEGRDKADTRRVGEDTRCCKGNRRCE